MTSLAPDAALAREVHRPRRLLLDRSIAACCAISVALHVGLGARGLLVGAFVAILVELAAIDLERRVLPNRIVIPTLLFVLGAWLAVDPSRYAESLLSAVGAGLFMFLPTLLRPGAVGMGDVKLALLLGAALGRLVVPAFVLGLCATGAFALLLVASRGRSALKEEIPLGPFLAAGAIAAILLAAPGAVS